MAVKIHSCSCRVVIRGPARSLRKPVARRIQVQGTVGYDKFGAVRDTRRYGWRCTKCGGKRKTKTK